VPITFLQYLQFETYVPVATLVGVTAWLVFARSMTRDLRKYPGGVAWRADRGGAAGPR